MQTRHRNTFTTIRTEGAILPPDLLLRISEGDAALEGLLPTDYHLLQNEKLNEAINRSWNRLIGAWESFKAAREKVLEGQPGTTVTRERWLLPLFQELGFGRLQTSTAFTIDSKSYPISHLWGRAPIHLLGFNVALDKRTPGVAGAAQTSPHSMVQEFLNRSDDHLWALLSNGTQLRILRDNASLTRQAYVEFDLQAMMEGEVYADFVLLWLLCHQSRVEGEKPEEFWLEKWSRTAQEQGARALDQLRGGVEDAISQLGTGFLSHPANQALRGKLRDGSLNTQNYYRQLLRLVYRLIFLFVAEDRDLLFPPDSDPITRQRYTDYYSTRRLRRLAERSRGSRHADLYHTLRLVMNKLGGMEGCEELAIPALGGFLFSDDANTDLNQAELSNQYLLDAVRALAYTVDNRTLRPVDYKNLGPEELGSVYESLLELHPELNVDAASFALSTAGGHERKTTGSYYTPSSLIQVLLDSALDPVIEDRLETVRKEFSRKDAKSAKEVQKNNLASFATLREAQERALLDLKVCDPASGSGHFLIAASHRIAKRLAAVRTGDDEPSPEATRTALRDVISQCIYGVDINPMAVELCKVSLWMEALEPGKPLSFLDAHIKCGNSLVGVGPGMDITEIPDKAFQPAFGDDRATATALRRRNKREREGQLGFRWDGTMIKYHQERSRWMARQSQELDSLPEEQAEQVRAKERAYQSLITDSQYLSRRLEYDLWTAAFFWPIPEGDAESMLAPTQQEFIHLREGQQMDAELVRRVREISEEQKFFHWDFMFFQVFRGGLGGFDCVLSNPPWEVPKADPKEFATQYFPAIVELSRKNFKKWFDHQLEIDEIFRDRWEQVLRERDIIVNNLRSLLPGGERIVRESNLYKGFILRGVGLRPKVLGFVLPSSFHTDPSTLPLRDLTIFSHSSILVALTNDNLIYPSLPHIFRFDLLACHLFDKTDDIKIAFIPAATPGKLHSLENSYYHLVRDDIEKLSPGILSIPEFQDSLSYEISTLAYRNGTPIGNLDGERNISFKKEAYNTSEHDVGAFSNDVWDIPYCEGSSVKPFLWRPESCGKGYKESIFSRRFKEHTSIGKWRLVFKLIVSQSNVRRMQVCLAPPLSVFGQNVPTLSVRNETKNLLLAILGILNSFVFEYLVRMKTGAALSKPLLFSLPIPESLLSDHQFINYVELALTNIEGQPPVILEYLQGTESPSTLDYSKARSKIDALVADAFGLNKYHYAAVLSVFDLLDKDKKSLPGEDKSFITRDCAILEFLKLKDEPIPIDIVSFYNNLDMDISEVTGPIRDLQERIDTTLERKVLGYV